LIADIEDFSGMYIGRTPGKLEPKRRNIFQFSGIPADPGLFCTILPNRREKSASGKRPSKGPVGHRKTGGSPDEPATIGTCRGFCSIFRCKTGAGCDRHVLNLEKRRWP
jgi:hypothetical protein